MFFNGLVVTTVLFDVYGRVELLHFIFTRCVQGRFCANLMNSRSVIGLLNDHNHGKGIQIS